MALQLILLIFVVLMALILFYNYYYKRLNLPPGPTPLPLLGNTLSFVSDPLGEKCFTKWSKTYGDVYTYWLGELPVIGIASHQKIIETFQKDSEAFSGRLTFEEFDRLSLNFPEGIAKDHDEWWWKHRRFILHVFREFGVGKNLMQERILDEFTAIADKLDAACLDQDFMEINLQEECFEPAIGSIINNILFGYRFTEDRIGEYNELRALLKELIHNVSEFMMLLVMWKPRLFGGLPMGRQKWLHYKKVMGMIHDFFESQIQEHKKTIAFSDPDASPSDYVEAFLKEQQKLGTIGGNNTFMNSQLKQICFALWLAGQHTTASTLGWTFAYLLHNPSVMKRAQAELDEVMGKNNQRFITVSDRSNLPYINAITTEVLRIATQLPVWLLHRTTRDVIIDGYKLPKGTAVAPQIIAVHMDEENFENPHDFLPERFLDENCQKNKSDTTIPFSIGRRQCLGESLARMQLFLFTSNLLYRYTFLPAKEMPLMQKDSFSCPKFTCLLKKRI